MTNMENVRVSWVVAKLAAGQAQRPEDLCGNVSSKGMLLSSRQLFRRTRNKIVSAHYNIAPDLIIVTDG
jgi:hypothetical protein